MICPQCGYNTSGATPLFVTITPVAKLSPQDMFWSNVGNPSTYRLGQVVPGGKIECLKPDGLVRRVCHYDSSVHTGQTIITSGERLHFHRDSEKYQP